MQRDPVVSKASELLRLGLMPSPEELRAGKVSSHVLLEWEMAESDFSSSAGPAFRGHRERCIQTEGRVKHQQYPACDSKIEHWILESWNHEIGHSQQTSESVNVSCTVDLHRVSNTAGKINVVSKHNAS